MHIIKNDVINIDESGSREARKITCIVYVFAPHPKRDQLTWLTYLVGLNALFVPAHEQTYVCSDTYDRLV